MSPRPVPSCHAAAAHVAVAQSTPVVALVGSPNVGKSTLFNALTGAQQGVGNWPGTTVEVGQGVWRTGVDQHPELVLVDLPGAYSLDPISPDEELTHRLLVDAPVDERPDAVVVVASAAQLSRGLYLLAQVREQPGRHLLALTMTDVARRRGDEVDVDALSQALGVPVVELDPRARSGGQALAVALDRLLADPPAPARRLGTVSGPDDDLLAAEERFTWVASAVTAAVRPSADPKVPWSDRIDRAVTAPVLGPLLFLGVMWLVFQLTTTVAAPLQSALDRLVSGPVSSLATGLLDLVGLGGTWVQGLVVGGLVAGVGMVLTFLPLMAIMFALLALLEDSGYLARAAVVTDRLMRTIGLPGRAFLPLVVGFGCNVPAISATRVLPDARHRLLTALLVPFTSCSARLTVYVLVATTFFGGRAGTVVFAMYLLSIVMVVAVGRLLRSTLLRTMGDEPLVLDLPPYQVPTPRIVTMVTWVRLRGFLRTASGIIVAAVVAVWVLSATPTPGSGGGFGSVPVQHSVYASVARTIAPTLRPAGFGEWQTASALVVGFVAKEAVISSWAQTYATAEPSSARQPGSLGTHLRAGFDASSDGHPRAAVLAFLVFLLAYTPCVATLAAQRREIGLRWTAFGVGLQLVVAWTCAVVVFQLGRLLW